MLIGPSAQVYALLNGINPKNAVLCVHMSVYIVCREPSLIAVFDLPNQVILDHAAKKA